MLLELLLLLELPLELPLLLLLRVELLLVLMRGLQPLAQALPTASRRRKTRAQAPS